MMYSCLGQDNYTDNRRARLFEIEKFLLVYFCLFLRGAVLFWFKGLIKGNTRLMKEHTRLMKEDIRLMKENIRLMK